MLRELNGVEKDFTNISGRITGVFKGISAGLVGVGAGVAIWSQVTKAVDAYTASVGRASDTSVSFGRTTNRLYEAAGRNISQGYDGLAEGLRPYIPGRTVVDQVYNATEAPLRALLSTFDPTLRGEGEGMSDAANAREITEQQSRQFVRQQMELGLRRRSEAVSLQAGGDVAGSMRTRLEGDFAARRSAASDQFAEDEKGLARELEKINAEHKVARQELELQLSIRQRMLDLEIRGYEFEQQSAAAARLKTEYREKAAILAEADIRLAREFAAIEARSDITLDQKNERKAQAARANVETTNAAVGALERQQKLRDRDISNSIQDSSREAEIQVKKLTNREGEAELDAQRLEYFRRVREAQQDEELRVRNPELYKQRIDSIRAEAAQVIPATAAELARSSRYQLRAIEAGLPTRGAFGASPGQNSFGMFGIGSVNGSGQSGPDEQLIRTIDGLKAALQAATDALKNNGGLGP